MASATGTIALIASRVRTDEKLMIAAFERQRAAVEVVDSRRLWLGLGDARPSWTVAVNREIGFARALYAARAVEAAGVPVINTARATQICGDKWQTSVALDRAGIPTPRTALALTPDAALDALAHIGYPAVIKPLVGSWGRLVTPLADEATARIILEYVAALPHPSSHIAYVQELVDKGGRDIRVAVVGGRPIAAAYRSAAEWRTNVHRGAETGWCPLTGELSELARQAANVVGAEIAGVDIVEDSDGRPLVLEVNHGFEFAGLQQALGDRLDVADEVVAHLVARARDGVPSRSEGVPA